MRRTHPVIAFDLDGTPSRIRGHLRDAPDGEPAFVEEWCRSHGAALHEVAVVGDSRSDAPCSARREGPSPATPPPTPVPPPTTSSTPRTCATSSPLLR
ncbi:hypothetical protein ACFY20_09500 [Streptomyces sp. NPDC001312]|uniref:hypothetical protein n=1 Tax=Streptomyces sp. NPDC001312 TaxID=3364561 RepID=UPI0036927893